MIGEKGQYGYIGIVGSNDNIDVCYLAICQYDNDKKTYLFFCDENMSVEQDQNFDNFEHAYANAQGRTKSPIIWFCP